MGPAFVSCPVHLPRCSGNLFYTEAMTSLFHRLESWAASPCHQHQICHSVVRVLLITIREFRRNELALRASALTYTVLLSLVPLLAMSTALVKGVGGGNHLQQVVYDYIDTLEQGAGRGSASAVGAGDAGAEKEGGAVTLTSHLRAAADKLFAYVDQTDFTTLGSIGVLLMLITIIMVFDTIEKAMNTIWQVSAGRSAMRKMTDYLALLILMPVAINSGFAATTVLKNPGLLAWITPFLPVSWLHTTLLLLLPVVCIALALMLCYMVFPNTKVQILPALTGGVLAAIFWFITQNVFVSLQVGVSNYNTIYGSFATLPLFLTWSYLGWIFILTGAQIAFACQSYRHYHLSPAPVTPMIILSAALDIVTQITCFFAQQQPVTVAMLPALCPEYSQAALSQALDHLLAADIVHEEPKQRRVFLSMPVTEFQPGLVVKTVLGTELPVTEGGRHSQRALEAASRALST